MREAFADVLSSMQDRLQKFADTCTANGYPTKLVKAGATKFEIVTVSPIPKKDPPATVPKATKAPKAAKVTKTKATSDKPAKQVKTVKSSSTNDTVVQAAKRKPGRPKKVVDTPTN